MIRGDDARDLGQDPAAEGLALDGEAPALVVGQAEPAATELRAQEPVLLLGRRYVSLERPDVRARALADPVAFLDEASPPLILDEVQYAPELLHWVKERIDARRRPGDWLLSGSQSFPLMRGVSQTLAGRVAVLTLDPFSTREAAGMPASATIEETLESVFGDSAPPAAIAAPVSAGARSTAIDLGEWLLRGGYPELRADPEVDRRLWFSGYVQTYLQRDIRDLVQVGDLDAFSRFLVLVAARTGSLLNMSDLGRDVGVTGPTIKRWLSVLEASHVVYLLRPHHVSHGKRLIRSPKLYLTDVGLASWLLGLHHRDAILQGPSAGALTETAVVAEWLKRFRAHGIEPSLYFWSSPGRAEVDLLIDHGGRLHALEVKATATPTPRHADGLAAWLALAGPGARGALACRIDAPTPLRPGVRAVPWHLAWCGAGPA